MPVKRKKTKKKSKIPDAISEQLNEKQKLFCYLYVTDRTCFGNATASYRTAYGLTKKQYDSSKSNAHRLLTNGYIKDYVNSLLDESFNEVAVDRELSRVMKQNKDLQSKSVAIKEFNKLKARIFERSEVTHILPKPILEYVRSNESNKKDS